MTTHASTTSRQTKKTPLSVEPSVFAAKMRESFFGEEARCGEKEKGDHHVGVRDNLAEIPAIPFRLSALGALLPDEWAISPAAAAATPHADDRSLPFCSTRAEAASSIPLTFGQRSLHVRLRVTEALLALLHSFPSIYLPRR